MNELIINNKKYIYPSTWSECTHQQLKRIAQLWGVSYLQGDNIDQVKINSIKMQLLFHFIKANSSFKHITASQFADILPSLDFIHGKVDYNADPKTYFKHWFKKYVGPTKGLRTTSFDEFIYVDTLFTSMSKKKDLTIAYDIVGALYRPQRKDLAEWKLHSEYNGDEREEFNALKAKEYGHNFRKWMSLYDAMAIVYFYWGWRNTYLLKYETLFPKPKEGEQPSEGTNYGWIDTRLVISGQKFGDYKNTGKTNWQTIIFDMHLTEEKRRAEEKRREMQALKNKTKHRYG
jgi:hypothetical protein